MAVVSGTTRLLVVPLPLAGPWSSPSHAPNGPKASSHGRPEALSSGLFIYRRPGQRPWPRDTGLRSRGQIE